MTELLKKEFYQKLDYDKIKINWNKNPIPVNKFLSFLTVNTVLITDHLGSSTGWTLRENKEEELKIKGGIVNGTNWLDSIEYKKKLQNPYNNYVNPFFLTPIMTKEGIDFFLDYYKDDINKILRSLQESKNWHINKAKELLNTHSDILVELQKLGHV